MLSVVSRMSLSISLQDAILGIKSSNEVYAGFDQLFCKDLVGFDTGRALEAVAIESQLFRQVLEPAS